MFFIGAKSVDFVLFASIQNIPKYYIILYLYITVSIYNTTTSLAASHNTKIIIYMLLLYCLYLLYILHLLYYLLYCISNIHNIKQYNKCSVKLLPFLYSCMQVFLYACILVYNACFLYGHFCNNEMQENKGVAGRTPSPLSKVLDTQPITLSIFRKF